MRFDRETNIFPRPARPTSILSYDHYFFQFHFFGGTRPRAAELLRFVCIFKEPMISRNSFGKPVKCIATKSCL